MSALLMDWAPVLLVMVLVGLVVVVMRGGPRPPDDYELWG